MFACFLAIYIVIYKQPFAVKRQSLLKDGKEGNMMTQPELILRLIELLLAERDKSNALMKAEENKKDKD